MITATLKRSFNSVINVILQKIWSGKIGKIYFSEALTHSFKMTYSVHVIDLKMYKKLKAY